MNASYLERVEVAVAEAKRLPTKWGWPITGVLHVKGKVIVQATTPKGKCAQFLEKV